MATIKSYTDLEQSKKLAAILSPESADMCWTKYIDNGDITSLHATVNYGIVPIEYPCWSFAALLGVMTCPNLEEYIEGVWDLTAFTDNTLKTPIEIQDCKDPVDACVAMIEKLHELKML